MISCDWCGNEIDGSEVGYTVRADPFSPLNLGGQHNATKDKVSIVAEIHLHEHPCRERWITAAQEVAREHVALEDENDRPTAPERSSEPEKTPEQKESERTTKRWRAWRKLPKHEQDRLVLEAFDDGRYTNSELLDRMRARAGEDDPVPCWVNSEIATITRRLFKAGELERQEGQFGKSRFRYARSKPSAELEALAKQLDGGEES